jgi:hypothetical protein
MDSEADFMREMPPREAVAAFLSKASCNQEYAGGFEQSLNDEAEAVVA